MPVAIPAAQKGEKSMSTPSLIGKLNPDGTVTSIYCHWDGHPWSTGNTLATHYTTEAKINALLALGNLSALNEEIGEKHDFGRHFEEHKNWCLAYGRDREDPEDQSAWTDVNREDLVLTMGESGAKYVYLWDSAGWLCSDGGAWGRMRAEVA